MPGQRAGGRRLASQYRGHGVAREVARQRRQERAGAAGDKGQRSQRLLHVRVLGELVQPCCQVGDQQLPPRVGEHLGLARGARHEFGQVGAQRQRCGAKLAEEADVIADLFAVDRFGDAQPVGEAAGKHHLIQRPVASAGGVDRQPPDLCAQAGVGQDRRLVPAQPGQE